MGYHEISPADIPAFLSIYKDLYQRPADTLPPPRPSPARPRGQRFAKGWSSWPRNGEAGRERENKASLGQARVEERIVEESDKRNPTAPDSSSLAATSGFRVLTFKVFGQRGE